jgi:hypothetical protein
MQLFNCIQYVLYYRNTEAQPPTDKRHVPALFQRINLQAASLHLTLAVTPRMTRTRNIPCWIEHVCFKESPPASLGWDKVAFRKKN